MNASFSVHTWILWRGETDADQTIFSKDRYGSDFTPNTQKFLHAYIEQTSGKVVFEFISEVDQAFPATGATALTPSTWYYLVFSVELNSNRRDSDVKIFLNNNETPDASISSNDSDTDDSIHLFVVDDPDYNMYLATARSDATTFG